MAVIHFGQECNTSDLWDIVKFHSLSSSSQDIEAINQISGSHLLWWGITRHISLLNPEPLSREDSYHDEVEFDSPCLWRFR